MQPTTQQEHRPRSPLQRIIQNSGWNAIGMVLNVSLNFISLMILAKRLGPTILGFYFAVVAVSFVVYLVLGGGIATVVTARIAKNRSRLRQHVREGTGLLMLTGVGSILAFTLCGVLWLQWQAVPLHWSAFAMMGVCVAGRQAREFAAGGFRGIERFEFENILSVVQSLVFAGIVIFLVPKGEAGLFWALAGLTVSSLTAGVLLQALLMRKSKSAGFTCHPAIVRNWLAESIPLGFGDVMRRLAWQVDTLLLSLLTSPTVVGLYSLAYRPLHPLQLVPMTIASATFPAMSRWATTDRSAFARAYELSLSALWMVSLPITVAIAVVAERLIALVAGTEFLGAVIPLRIIVAMIPFIFLSTQLRFVLLALNEQKLYWCLTTAILIGKIVVGLALIPIAGLYGACAGTVIAELALASLAMLLVRQRGVDSLPWRCLFRATLAACAMGALLWPFRDASLIVMGSALMAAIPAYLCLCVVFGALEVELLRQIKDAVMARVAPVGPRTPPAIGPQNTLMDGNAELGIDKETALLEGSAFGIASDASGDLSASSDDSIVQNRR